MAAAEPIAIEFVLAVRAGDIDRVTRHVVDHVRLPGTRFIAKDGGTRTALHVVTDWPGYFPNGPEMVRRLVDAGSDPDVATTGRGSETRGLRMICAAVSPIVDRSEFFASYVASVRVGGRERVPGRAQCPAAGFAAQDRDGERGDVDPPEPLRCAGDRGQDRRADHRGVGDDHGVSVPGNLAEPGGDPGDQLGECLAAVRRPDRIGQPGSDRFGLLGGDVIEGAALPPTEVPITQQWFGLGLQPQRGGRSDHTSVRANTTPG